MGDSLPTWNRARDPRLIEALSSDLSSEAIANEWRLKPEYIAKLRVKYGIVEKRQNRFALFLEEWEKTDALFEDLLEKYNLTRRHVQLNLRQAIAEGKATKPAPKFSRAVRLYKTTQTTKNFILDYNRGLPIAELRLKYGYSSPHKRAQKLYKQGFPVRLR